MRGAACQPLLGKPLQLDLEFGEGRPVLGLVGPAHHQEVLDVLGSLYVCQGLLDASGYLPNDGFRRLATKWPLSAEKLVPHRPAKTNSGIQ